MSLETYRKGVDDILKLLRSGEWQIPLFQREFVWTPSQVSNLINSFLKSYPIGLITVWKQKQGEKYTESEALKLHDGSFFKDYIEDPAVIKLVLDGKQRLTSLAMIFDGFGTKNDRHKFSGGWFIDIDAYSAENEIEVIKYKKKRDIENEDLNTVATCVKKALIPLKDLKNLVSYISSIHNPSIYPEKEYPDEAIRKARIDILNKLQEAYNRFQIPVAEIPETVDLGAVCEIFDVLNTTGTKVSTFDLIHNRLFNRSNGTFLLRETVFKAFLDESYLGVLLDRKRPEFFAQLVTGCYLSESNPFRADDPEAKKKVDSIKGKDLINTPLEFYKNFFGRVKEMEEYAEDLCTQIFGETFKLSEIPYPAQIILYFSIRHYLTINHLGNSSSYLHQTNRIFKAFFWRNTLTTRYDQGFLTQISKDLVFLKDLILKAGKEGAGLSNHDINDRFKEHFTSDKKLKTKDEILDLIFDSKLKGALNQGLNLFLNSSAIHDLLTGDVLDRFGDKKKKVQMHHIFPKQWCSDNKGANPIIAEYGADHLANLLPLTAESNLRWKSKSPATAIRENGIVYEDRKSHFAKFFIDQSCFEYLSNDQIDLFWKARAEKLAEAIYGLQFVD